MSTIIWIIIITTISGVVGTGIGGLIGAVLGRNSSKTVSLLLSFAAGVMLSVVCFDLVVKAIAPNDGVTINIFIVILGVFFGYGVVFLLNYWIDRRTNHEVRDADSEHPATADDLDELIHSDHLSHHRTVNNSQYQLFIAGVVMALAIALHNLPEGMVIGASFAGDNGIIALTSSAIVLAIIIGLHNIPEGMAVSVPLISGGMGKARAVLITAASGFPTVIGAIIGYYIGMFGNLGLSLSLSFASGAMLYVVLGELLPEAILMWRSKLPAFATFVGMIVGLFIVYA